MVDTTFLEIWGAGFLIAGGLVAFGILAWWAGGPWR